MLMIKPKTLTRWGQRRPISKPSLSHRSTHRQNRSKSLQDFYAFLSSVSHAQCPFNLISFLSFGLHFKPFLSCVKYCINLLARNLFTIIRVVTCDFKILLVKVIFGRDASAIYNKLPTTLRYHLSSIRGNFLPFSHCHPQCLD